MAILRSCTATVADGGAGPWNTMEMARSIRQAGLSRVEAVGSWSGEVKAAKGAKAAKGRDMENCVPFAGTARRGRLCRASGSARRGRLVGRVEDAVAEPALERIVIDELLVELGVIEHKIVDAPDEVGDAVVLGGVRDLPETAVTRSGVFPSWGEAPGFRKCDRQIMITESAHGITVMQSASEPELTDGHFCVRICHCLRRVG